MQDLLRKAWRLPADDESLTADVEAALEALERAADVLRQAYQSVITKLTRDESLDEMVAVSVSREMGMLFPSPGSKPDARSRPAVADKPDRPAMQIPDDALESGGHSYYIFIREVTQAEAVEECRKLGGYLARITEVKEWNLLRAKLQPLARDLSYWVDGTDAGHEGVWTFLDGTNMPPRIPWSPNQPDNRTYGSYSSEGGRSRYVSESENGLCVILSRPFFEGPWGLGLNDAQQSRRQGFICEWDALRKKRPRADAESPGPAPSPSSVKR